MRTVKTILKCKPFNIHEVEAYSRRNPQYVERVKITESIEVTPEQYEEMTEDTQAENYDFLDGKGGYDDNDMHQVVEITCKGKKRFYVDPSGYNYCCYVGIKVEN